MSDIALVCLIVALAIVALAIAALEYRRAGREALTVDDSYVSNIRPWHTNNPNVQVIRGATRGDIRPGDRITQYQTWAKDGTLVDHLDIHRPINKEN